MNHSARYHAHLQSPEWARIRKAALERAGYRCALCGLHKSRLWKIGRHLEVHHNTYVNLGHERPEDLTVLCAGGHGACHSLADQARRSHTQRARTKRKRRRRTPKVLRDLRAVALTLSGSLIALKILSLTLPT
jgi:5-methylcytosine-specific restriction endonuclease McrA